MVEASVTIRMNIPYLDLKAVTALHGEEIQKAVAEVVGGGWYLQGAAVQQFEQHYAAYIGTRHCVGVANGLDALTLTLRAYKEMGRIGEGDEVLVPANTFIATVLAITENGLTPVFIDVDADTLDLNLDQLQQSLTSKTKALMLVHLYGRCTYNESIRAFCQANGLLLIEDNAQAHGCAYLSSWTSRDTLMNGAAAGHFFENYVVGELLRTYAYAKSSAALTFYRDKDQREIDLVIEQDGVLHPLEIKKASEPDRRALKVFDLLKKTGRPIGPGGIVCMTDRPFPISEEYSYIPANLI